MLRRQSCLWMCLQKPSDRFCAHHEIQIGCLKSVFETGALASHTARNGGAWKCSSSRALSCHQRCTQMRNGCVGQNGSHWMWARLRRSVCQRTKDIDEDVQKAPADSEWVKHALVKFLVGTGTVLSGNWLARLGITTIMIWTWHVVM